MDEKLLFLSTTKDFSVCRPEFGCRRVLGLTKLQSFHQSESMINMILQCYIQYLSQVDVQDASIMCKEASIDLNP